jgi:hypothetical protein
MASGGSLVVHEVLEDQRADPDEDGKRAHNQRSCRRLTPAEQQDAAAESGAQNGQEVRQNEHARRGRDKRDRALSLRAPLLLGWFLACRIWWRPRLDGVRPSFLMGGGGVAAATSWSFRRPGTALTPRSGRAFHTVQSQANKLIRLERRALLHPAGRPSPRHGPEDQWSPSLHMVRAPDSSGSIGRLRLRTDRRCPSHAPSTARGPTIRTSRAPFERSPSTRGSLRTGLTLRTSREPSPSGRSMVEQPGAMDRQHARARWGRRGAASQRSTAVNHGAQRTTKPAARLP